jgi:hypothetical protein
MHRAEAILILEEILTSCEPIDVTFISLEHYNIRMNNRSEDYELHFKSSIDDETFNIIKKIISAHNLGLKDYDGKFIIYTPQKREEELIIS